MSYKWSYTVYFVSGFFYLCTRGPACEIARPLSPAHPHPPAHHAHVLPTCPPPCHAHSPTHLPTTLTVVISATLAATPALSNPPAHCPACPLATSLAGIWGSEPVGHRRGPKRCSMHLRVTGSLVVLVVMLLDLLLLWCFHLYIFPENKHFLIISFCAWRKVIFLKIYFQCH